MKAIIMAGGKGARLMPYTALLPKPLMPIGDMPILELLLRQLKQYGVTEVILAVNHLAHLIASFFGEGEKLGIKITYSVEDRPLGTAGAIAANLEDLSDDFIVSNGDLLTTLNFRAMIAAHLNAGASATLAAHRRTIQVEFGALTIEKDDSISEVREKPTMHFDAGMGMYVLQREAVRPFFQPDTYLDMPDLVRSLISRGDRVQAYMEDCTWIDIGRPEDYGAAQEQFVANRAFFLPEDA
jgi:NDP-sugar pyrophosphorylase family protein